MTYYHLVKNPLKCCFLIFWKQKYDDCINTSKTSMAKHIGKRGTNQLEEAFQLPNLRLGTM